MTASPLTRWPCGLLGFLALLLVFAAPGSALEVPPLKGRVNDYAGMLAPATARQLEELLRQFEATESTQIVVLTIPSLEGDSLEDFSLRVAEAWRPGQAKLDNGALLLIAKNDRRLRIEVGYGLEGKLTDLVSGRIIREIITPRFKAGNFDQGVIDGTSAMIGAVRGEFSAAAATRQPAAKMDPGGLFFFLVIVFSLLGRMLSRAPLVAAGIGALAAPVLGATLLGVGLAGMIVLAVTGFIFGLMAAAGGGFSSRHAGWMGGSRGGFSGGFGGFSGGGGSFGGGGSSGRW